MGDSAGGNLSTAITSWSIVNKGLIKIPDILYMNYPVLNLDTTVFKPSFLYSLQDYILNFNMLLLCRKSYLEYDVDVSKDFLISPNVTPNEILKRFPRIILLIC